MNLTRLLAPVLILAWAGCSSDVVQGPDANQVRPDAAARVDAGQAGPDAAGPSDAGGEAVDARVPGEDAALPGEDAGADGGVDDVGLGASDVAVGVDAAQPGPDAAQPGEDAALPGLDAAQAGPDAAPAPIPGIYEVHGTDPTWGAYSGFAELRPAAGGYTVHHVQTWDTARFETEKIALAWEGTASAGTSPGSGVDVAVTLDRVGFVQTYQAETRAGVDPAPVAYSASLTRSAADTLTGTFTAQAPATVPSFQETWTWSAANGAAPLWRNERTEIAGHDPIPSGTRSTLFSTYAAYHQLPELAPYTGRADFQAAMHSFVRDRTDFAFYRANPDTLRVIQRVVDPIAVVEARLRNRAFRQTLVDKAAHFDAQVPLHHLNPAGMLISYDPSQAPPLEIPSGDSMLWTGVYAASQALRYEATADPAALQNLLTALRGQFLCFDIVGVNGDFARTLRVHVADGDPSWVQGTGANAGYDWLKGANNDMLKGYFVSFPWAYRVLSKLPGYTAEKQKMVAILENLVTYFPVAKDDGGNELLASGLLYWMTGNLSRLVRFETLFAKERGWVVDQGNGAMWEYGTSDWSGNHLIVQSLLTLYLVCDETNNHTADMKRAMRLALERMRHTRLGLYQLITATVGEFSGVTQPELEEALEVLEEISAPKTFEDVDWRVNPSYSMSPFPALPWKGDWMAGGRLQSLRAYPLFETPRDVFAWKDNPLAFRRNVGAVVSPGADFLFAYWFARAFSVVDPAR